MFTWNYFIAKNNIVLFFLFFFVFQNIFVPQKYTLPEALEIYVLCRGVFPVADVFSKVFDELFCRTPQANCFCDSNNVDNTQTECFKTSVLYWKYLHAWKFTEKLIKKFIQILIKSINFPKVGNGSVTVVLFWNRLHTQQGYFSMRIIFLTVSWSNRIVLSRQS